MGKHDHSWAGLKDTRMKYEKADPMHFGAGSATFQASDIWKKCEKCGKECLGPDGLEAHTADRHPNTSTSDTSS